MRLRAALVLFALVIAPLPNAAPTSFAGNDGAAVDLTMEGENGAAIPVDGIACDNLRGTPIEQRDRLEVRLPAGISAQDVFVTVCSPDGSAVDADGRNNVGTTEAEKGRLFYYPPDEYNRRQEPRGLRDVDGPATRIVMLKVSGRSHEGPAAVLAPKRIVLARTPVVMVHGINRGPDCWIAMVRATARIQGRDGKRLEIPASALDHFAPAAYEGVNFRDRNRYPFYLYYGSGPVEIGAALLARHIDTVRKRVLTGEPLPAIDYGRPKTTPKPFAYHDPDNKAGKPVRLACRRVDLIGWSYGGLIARWYLSGSRASAQDLSWPRYQSEYVLPGAGGRTLDLTPRTQYRQDVRKLIAIGSIWRGVPIVNCLNEIRFSKSEDPNALSHAPLRLPQWMPRAMWSKVGSDRNIGSFTRAIDTRIRVNSPAMEVMAIDSPWLSLLTYGVTDPDIHARAAPFRADVAYGSVAGDNSAYMAFGPVTKISPHGALLYFQKPARFPYLALEKRAGLAGLFSPIIGGARDYSDGIVPVWSAVIPGGAPGASRIVPASHDTYFTDPGTLEYTARWLNNAALPTGDTLNPLWNTPIQSRDGRKRWEFREGEMAPDGRGTLYGRIDGIGRILPGALFPARSLALRRETEDTVRVEWSAPAGGHLRRVTLYEGDTGTGENTPGHLRKLRTVEGVIESGQSFVVLGGLRKDMPYYIVAEAVTPNRPDPSIIVKSEPTRVPEN